MEDAEICLPHDVDQGEVHEWKSALPDMDYVVSIFKAMGDETRMSLLWLLSQDEWCVHDLAAVVGASVSNTSHHLRILRALRLVKTRREGRRVIYCLDDQHVESLLNEAFKHSKHG